jgi:hypothetical protein
MFKHSVLLATVLITALAATGAVAVQLNFGGDLGFYLFDVSNGSGIQPGRDTLGAPAPQPYGDTTSRINMQFGSHGLGLYWNVQLTDQVTVNVLTEVGATTGATPSLGRKLGTQFAESGTQKALAVPEANVQVMLPWQVQMSAGILRPIFTEDYGEKKGYQEANRLFKSSANAFGGEWHDLGVELYKPFEPGGGVSIPAYLYVLAGEQQFGDNNNNKTLMAHVAPAFWKLRLLGSYGFGKYDDLDSFSVSRYALGLGGDFSPFWFRTEFTGGAWDGAVSYNHRADGGIDTATFTQKPIGYYVKAGMSIIPDKLGFVLTYDQYTPDWTTWARLGYAGGGSNLTTEFNESYTTVGATIQYWVIPGSSVLLEYNRGMWKVGDGTLCKIDFNRITLGWRTVF